MRLQKCSTHVFISIIKCIIFSLGEFDIKDLSQGDFVLLIDSVTVISTDICLHGRWLKITEAKFSAGHLPPVFR